jgi:sporulation protein YabP
MHRLGMEQRTGLKVTGVINVISFDENTIIVDTEEGILNIKGNGLHVGRLTIEKGEADIDGRIDSLIYSDKKSASKKGDSLIKHLFS